MKKKVLGGLLAVSMIATMGAFNVSVSAAERPQEIRYKGSSI